MVVEDILDLLSQLVVDGTIKGEWHRNFIGNIQAYVYSGSAISTNQSATILKIASSYTTQLATLARTSPAIMKSWITCPTYKQQPYTSISVKREVRYLGADKLAFRFKADHTVVLDLKNTRSSSDFEHQRPKWNHQYKVWILTVTSSNLEKIMSLIQTHNFDYDAEVLEYVTLCSNSRNTKPTFFLYGEEDVIYGNVPNDPKLQYAITNLLGGELI